MVVRLLARWLWGDRLKGCEAIGWLVLGQSSGWFSGVQPLVVGRLVG